MWLVPVDKDTLEESLFNFLVSVSEGRPHAARPLIVEYEILNNLYKKPHPDLLQALKNALDCLLVEISSNPAEWGKIELPTSILGLVLAAQNALSPEPSIHFNDQKYQKDPIEEFTDLLIDTIPPANELAEVFAYHSVLRGIEGIIPSLTKSRRSLFSKIIELSPLTALWNLDNHTPSVINHIGRELLHGWRDSTSPFEKIWGTPEKWLIVVGSLLNNIHIARWIRHRWLTMPETRPSCRNIGLILEILLRNKECRRFILEFYEAYDYFYSKKVINDGQKAKRYWPIFEIIYKLIHVSGDNDAAIILNRRGVEYFLKFLPLVEIIIAKNGIPEDFQLLTLEFVMQIRELADCITLKSKGGISFSKISFEERDG
jgi:hypothetical protein